jgi:hypothetical protein
MTLVRALGNIGLVRVSNPNGALIASLMGALNANSLHRFLLKNNNTYKDSYYNNSQIVVRLEACYVGNDLAKKFSKLNPNMVVIAPSNAISNVLMVYNYVIDGGKYLLFYNGSEYKNY